MESFANLNYLIKKYLMKKCIPTSCHPEEVMTRGSVTFITLVTYSQNSKRYFWINEVRDCRVALLIAQVPFGYNDRLLGLVFHCDKTFTKLSNILWIILINTIFCDSVRENSFLRRPRLIVFIFINHKTLSKYIIVWKKKIT